MRVALILAAMLTGSLVGAPTFAACAKPETLAKLSGAQGFEQTRTLKGVKRPMKSSGVVEVSGANVMWKVTSPVSIVTKVTPQGITQSVDGGPEEKLGPAAGSNPFLTESGLMDILKGDFSAMEQRYVVKRENRTKPEGWKLDLSPRSAQLSPYIAGVRIEGCKRIEAISVDQANGDSIRIDLKAGS